MGSIATGHPDLLSFNAADAKEVKRPVVVQKQVDHLEIYDIFNYYELEYYRTMVQHDETILQLRAGTATALEGTSAWFEHMLKQYDVVDSEMRRKSAILLIYHAGGLNPDGTADPQRAKQVNQCLKQSQALNTYIKRLRLAALIGSESRDRLNVDMCHVLNLLYLLITFNHEDKDFCRVLRAEDSIPKSVVCLLFDLVRCYNIEKNKTYPFKKLVTVLFCCLNSGLGSAALIESAKKSLLHQWGISKHGSNSKCSIHDLLSFEKHVTTFKCDKCSVTGVKEASSPKEGVKESPACDHKCQPQALVEGLNILRKHLSLPFADVKQLIVTSQRSTANDTKSLWELVHVVRQKQHADDSTAIGTLTICDSVNHVTYFDVIYRTLLPSWSEIIKICLDVMFSTVTARHDNSVNEVFYFMNELESRDWVREAARDTRRELPRHQSLLFSLLAHFLVLLLKHARYSNVMHFEYLTALVTQYRGIELCLKFLSQDLSSFLTSFVLHVTEMQSPRPRDSTPEPERDSSDSDTERDVDMITHSGSDLSVKELQRRVVELNIDLTRTHPHESRALHAVTSTVKLLRKMIREHPFRIAYVVKFKAQTTLKRLNEIDHEDLKLEFYKLIKTMLPYIHKKWRAKHMAIISQIYYKVRPRLHDNWLSTTFSRESDADPNQFRELENAALKSIEIYHHVRYSAAAAGQSSHTATARRYSFDRSPRERPQLGPGNTSPTTERTA